MSNHPTWRPNPCVTQQYDADEILIGAGGQLLARVKRLHNSHAFWPTALNHRTGLPLTGEAWPSLPSAKAWAERVAGVRQVENA